ncbi:MAG: hypothetical protein ABJ242_11080 [Marinomonas sp.]
MLKALIGSIALSMAALPMGAAALANTPVSLSSEVQVIRIIEKDGTKIEALVPASKVVPGDRLVFTTVFHNQTDQTVQNCVLLNAVPKGITVAADGNFESSVDGGKTFAALSQLTVKNDDGSSRAANFADVSSLRWTIPSIAPGAKGEVKYFATVQ